MNYEKLFDQKFSHSLALDNDPYDELRELVLPPQKDCKTSTAKALQQLEQAYIHYYRGRTKQALELGYRAIAQKGLSVGTKLRISDLVGRCHRHHQSYREVYLSLQSQIKYLRQFCAKPFAFSIYTNYLEALIALDLEQEAREALTSYEKFFKKITDDILWAKYYLEIKRIQYTFAKKYQSDKKIWPILEAICELAQFVENDQALEYAQQELESYDFAEGYVNSFQGWSYLKQDHLALFFAEKRISKLSHNQTIKNIVEVLLRGPVTVNAFFKATARKTYDHKFDEKFLQQILSKLQCALSESSVVIYDGYIALL